MNGIHAPLNPFLALELAITVQTERPSENEHSDEGWNTVLVLVLLWALAVAQPLLSLFGAQPEFLVAHGFNAERLVGFALRLSIFFPALMAILVFVLRRKDQRLGSILFLTLMAVLLALIGIQLAVRLELQGAPAVLLAVVFALAGTIAYQKLSWVRLFARYFSPAVLVFPLVFLFASRASEIVLPRAADEGALEYAIPINTDIVFLFLDEFPLVSLMDTQLDIDRQRYPNFARLADTGTWYRGATTMTERTTMAVPVALTGIDYENQYHWLPLHSVYPRNLFTLLAPTHQIYALEDNTGLCPAQVCDELVMNEQLGNEDETLREDLSIIYRHLITPAPWSDSLQPIDNGWRNFAEASNLMQQAEENEEVTRQSHPMGRPGVFWKLNEAIEHSEGAQLFYAHVILPHSNWSHLPDGRLYVPEHQRMMFGIRAEDDPGITYPHQWHDDEHAINLVWQRHLFQVQYVDLLLGQMLDKLEDQGMMDDTLIVVVGDHGASFVAGQGRRSATPETGADITAVPLFIKYPKQRTGVIDDRDARLADILPTIAGQFSIDSDWEFTGESLLQSDDGETDDVIIQHPNGRHFRYPFEAHYDFLRERAAELELLFGSGANSRLFDYGSAVQYHGIELDEFTLSDTQFGEIKLDGADRFAKVKLDAHFIPLQIWGRWNGMLPEAGVHTILVALNGVIRASSHTFEIPEYENAFSAILPPDVLVEGNNELRFFVLNETDDGATLSEISFTP